MSVLQRAYIRIHLSFRAAWYVVRTSGVGYVVGYEFARAVDTGTHSVGIMSLDTYHSGFVQRSPAAST